MISRCVVLLLIRLVPKDNLEIFVMIILMEGAGSGVKTKVKK